MYDIAKGGLAATGAGVILIGGHAVSSALFLVTAASVLIFGGFALTRLSGKRSTEQ